MGKSQTYLEKLIDYFKNKISYKVLRMDIINEVNNNSQNIKNKKKIGKSCLHMNFIEENFSFFLVNTGIVNIYLQRNCGSLFYILGTTTFICSYTYLLFVFYGEERIFYRNCLRNDEYGTYLRKRSLNLFIFTYLICFIDFWKSFLSTNMQLIFTNLTKISFK